MKLHLPPSLRKALLTCLAAFASFTAPLATSLASGSFALGLVSYAMIASDARSDDASSYYTDDSCYSLVDATGYTGMAPVVTIDGKGYYVEIKSPQGDADANAKNTYYCTWGMDSTLTRTLTYTDTAPADYDFTINTTLEATAREYDENNNTNKRRITYSYINFSATDSGGAMHFKNAYEYEIEGHFIGNSVVALNEEDLVDGGAIYLEFDSTDSTSSKK